MAVEIVRYEDRYRQEVAVLLTRLWSKNSERNERYLQWRYLANPVLASPILHLAIDAGNVVAMRGARGVAWDIGVAHNTECHIVPCMGDTVVADTHSNQGLLNELTLSLLEDMAARGIQFTFNLSPSGVTLLSSLRNGWRSIGSWPTVVRREQRENPTGDPVMFTIMDRYLGRRDPKNDAIVVSDRPRPEAMARVAAATSGHGRIRPFKDTAFLEWRFENPLNEYRFLYYEDNGTRGYLVLENSERHPRWTCVLDIEASEPGIQAALIESAVALGKFDELRLWWLRLPIQAMRALQELGFAQSPAKGGIGRFLPTVLVRPTSTDGRKCGWSINDIALQDIANWDIKMLIADAT